MYRHVGLNDTWDVLLRTLSTLGRIALSRLCSAQGIFVAASFVEGRVYFGVIQTVNS